MKLTYEGVTASSPNFAEAKGIVIRTVTQTPLLLEPASESVVGKTGTLTVEYSLPEAASPGTAELLFTPTGGEPSVLTLPATAAGTHTVTLNPFDFALGGSLIGGPNALTGGEYTIEVSYQDALLNPAAASSATKVTFSHPTEQPVLLAPLASSRSSADLHVHYQLPEAALAGSLILKFEGSHTIEVVLANTEGTVGEHEFTLDVKNLLSNAGVVTSAAPSTPIPDGSYKLTLAYRGATATAGATATVSEVGIDSVALPPTLIAPVNGRVISERFTVEYSLPEAASPGAVELLLTPTGGEASVLTLPATSAGIHTLTLEPSDLAIGGSLISGPQALVSGEYTLAISYQDALLNPASSVSSTFTFASAAAKSGAGETGTTGAAGTGTTGTTTSAGGASGKKSAAAPAELSVRWTAIRPTRGHARALMATFPVVARALSYKLVVQNGRLKRSAGCRLSGSASHRHVSCLVDLPSTGRWVATATAAGPAGTLAEATTDARIRF